MKWFSLILAVFWLTACVSSERQEITRRPPSNFVAQESEAPRTATTAPTKPVTAQNEARKTTSNFQGQANYAVTQGSMLFLEGGKQHFLPFQEGPIESDLIRQFMQIDQNTFELLGGFNGSLNDGNLIINSNDVYDQKPIYRWVISDSTRYAVEIPEVARNRFKNEGFNYIALEVEKDKVEDKKFYFHVDKRNIDRPVVVNRDGLKVVRVVMGNSNKLNDAISQNLLLNEPPAQAEQQVPLTSKTSTKPIQLLHLVKLYFTPQQDEFVDTKYESTTNNTESNSNKKLVLQGRFTGDGIVTGYFDKGSTNTLQQDDEPVQYHFKQEALIVGRGAIKDKPTLMEIEYYTIKLGQDEDQLRLALQQAQFKSQQKLNVFFIEKGQATNKKPDFSFSLRRVDGSAKLALIKRQPLRIKKDGKFITPEDLNSAVLELDLNSVPEVIQ